MSEFEKNDFLDFVKGLEESGFEYWIPNTPVRFYPEGVKCGVPDDVPVSSYENMLMPFEMVGDGRGFTVIPARGDSMVDAGIHNGDLMYVMSPGNLMDGDTVIADIDGEKTAKAYFVDRKKRHWLVPRNTQQHYDPIPLDESMNVRIRGIVFMVAHNMPRSPYCVCDDIVSEYSKSHHEALEEKTKMTPLTDEQVEEAVKRIVPEIKYSRYWFSVYRVLVDRGYYKAEEMEKFAEQVNEWCPDAPHKANAKDLSKMNVECFRKPLKVWKVDNAPVKGKWYCEYLLVAKNFEFLLKTF